MKSLNYVASPTASAFHNSPKVVRGFMGPVGNGKSVACLQEGFRLSTDQWPNSEGVRKSRGIIVRNTNPELRTTTLNTWKQWFPEQKFGFVVMNPMIMTTVNIDLGDGTWMEMEVYFLAMDTDKDRKKLLSFECTWIFLNEAKELPYSIVKASRERIGRYPSVVDGYEDVHDDTGKLIYAGPRGPDGEYEPCKRKALVMDTNPPEDDHWWYQLAEEKCLKRIDEQDKPRAKVETAKIFDFFRGPAPLFHHDGEYTPNPAAENIKFLPGGYRYYLDMIAGNSFDHINVMVLGNYGAIVDGRIVYPAYNDLTHCPQKYVLAIPGLDICLGWDFGLTPAVVFGQQTDAGQMRVIAELVAEDMDVRTFARDKVKPFIQRNFSQFTIGFSLADPSGNNRGEGEGHASISILNDEYEMYDEHGNLDTLEMGFYTEAAPTNDPTLRIDAVGRFLIKMVNGEPGYVLSKACPELRRGKNGGYCYKRVNIPGSEERYRDKPDKNRYSHPADAEQYLALGFVGGFVRESEEDDGYQDDEVHDEPSAMGY